MLLAGLFGGFVIFPEQIAKKRTVPGADEMFTWTHLFCPGASVPLLHIPPHPRLCSAQWREGGDEAGAHLAGRKGAVEGGRKEICRKEPDSMACGLQLCGPRPPDALEAQGKWQGVWVHGASCIVAVFLHYFNGLRCYFPDRSGENICTFLVNEDKIKQAT